MKSLRTPDECFENLPLWPYQANYSSVDDFEGGELRVHHVDEGPRDADPILCMHGEPSWSYLYRHMIPPLTQAGHRVIAPDLVGFGRSDKPSDPSSYTYERHVSWMSSWLLALDLNRITLVCQDWGGLIGLRLATAFPERFSRLVIANTGLPTGDKPQPPAFAQWRKFSQEVEHFDSGAIVQMGTTSELPEPVVAAYNAPFPEESFTVAARRFPMLVPDSPEAPSAQENRDAWDVLHTWSRPVMLAFSDSDPVTKRGERAFLSGIPACAGSSNQTVVGAGHFLQEDAGPELANMVHEFIESHPV
ncbi:unannotated protein [freshwater metagenome]|uniref:Unannotated protein n=1 Tax=freshwater metagenome TaxID=449393 RepID=A0A6J6D3A7_9ZZZZ|nr:alpha/beta fold hydrolase [Actinomycetota bacterium]MTA64705.1 alpha/beta fold hydrolase [Actinomycetota bacterium]